jgi:hypothetical protein
LKAAEVLWVFSCAAFSLLNCAIFARCLPKATPAGEVKLNGSIEVRMEQNILPNV